MAKPLYEVTTVEVKKKRTVTTHGEINLFTIGMFGLGFAATMWIMGLGVAPDEKGGLTLTQRPRFMAGWFGSVPTTDKVPSFPTPYGPWNPVTGIGPDPGSTTIPTPIGPIVRPGKLPLRF